MIILLQYRLMIDINYAYFKIHFRFNIYDELLVDKQDALSWVIFLAPDVSS